MSCSRSISVNDNPYARISNVGQGHGTAKPRVRAIYAAKSADPWDIQASTHNAVLPAS